MKITFFADTDTLCIEFKAGAASETRELDDHVLLDLDHDGRIVAITVEHACEHTGMPRFSYEYVAMQARNPSSSDDDSDRSGAKQLPRAI